MPTATLPLSETISAESVEHVTEVVKSANQNLTPVYAIGGGTSLDLGLPAKLDGIGLELTSINQVLDYPARDMTITVGAGITIEQLRQTLSPESQRLPIDVPQASQATLGGLIASNHSGPHRFGHGTMRDHVIGIRAVDGRGNHFAGGGRVVKNVAGYDFCKLLTGSLGTLGVITEVTLKLRPIPPASKLVCCAPRDLERADRLLAGLTDSVTGPVIVELLIGPAWEDVSGLGPAPAGWLVLGFEGTETEVNWMTNEIQREWREQQVESVQQLSCDDAEDLYSRMVEFPADESAALVLKTTGVPSGTRRMIQVLREVDESIGIQAHAGNGVVIAKFSEFPPDGLSRVLAGKIEPVAAAASGSATILSNPSANEMTHHSVWGATDVPYHLMRQVKQAFDPNNILNPGRFVY
jgi:glycolate oxidase FAD binding subunit